MTDVRAFPPLFAPHVPALGSPEAAVVQRLTPFFQAGVLDVLSVLVVGRLARRTGCLDPDALLALALAVRAPQRGHLCVDLSNPEVGRLLPATSSPLTAELREQLRLPVHGWLDRVIGAAALVRRSEVPGLTPFVLDGKWLYTDRYWSYQTDLAGRLMSMATQVCPIAKVDLPLLDQGLDLLFRPPQRDGIWPHEPAEINRQRLAGGVALTRQLAVIAGGPGMGKTWTVRNLLALLWLRHRARFARGEVDHAEPSIALAAPTGKAAARMKEALRAKLQVEFVPAVRRFLTDESTVQQLVRFLQSVETRTLHRLLGWQHRNPTRFRHHAGNPLPYDIVVVDEASMVDFAMMSKLVAAVSGDGPGHEPTRLLLLGDRNQLASVEAGTVLADICGETATQQLQITEEGVAVLSQFGCLKLLDSGLADQVERVPGPPFRDAVVQFNRTYRFRDDSGIGQFARACTRTPFVAEKAAKVLVRGTDVQLLPPGVDGRLPVDVQSVLLAGYKPYLQLLNRGGHDRARYPTEAVFHRRVLETFDRFRVLCAHRSGRTGVSGVNEAALALLRQADLVREPGRWAVGRPVLIQRNDYTVRKSGGGRGLYNGDVGLVVRATVGGKSQVVVAFPGIDGLPPADANGAFPALNPADYEGKRVVDYVVPARLPEHSTAFAMTIHKSQGSEFDHVLIVLPTESSAILTRELIYTGVTRAKHQMTMVADRALLIAALEKTVARASGLRRALWPWSLQWLAAYSRR